MNMNRMMLQFFIVALLWPKQAVIQSYRLVIPTVRSRTSSTSRRCESQLMGSEGLKIMSSVPTLKNESDGLNEEVAKVALPALAACEIMNLTYRCYHNYPT